MIQKQTNEVLYRLNNRTYQYQRINIYIDNNKLIKVDINPKIICMRNDNALQQQVFKKNILYMNASIKL